MESSQKLNTLQSLGASFDRLAFSFDGARLISYRASGSDAVHLWDTITGNLESTLDATGQVHVAMHPARNEALITSTEQGALIWQYRQNVRQPITDKPMIHGVFSSDGSQFIIGSPVPLPAQPWQLSAAPTTFAPSTLERWSRDDLVRQDSIEISAASITDFHLSRDGRVFVNTTRRFGIVNHDVATHQPTAYVPGHIAPITESLFTSDSRRLITASWDEKISVWNSTNGQHLKTLLGHNSPVYCAAITADDRLLVSGADDGQCILWNLESGEIEQRLNLAQSPIQHVAFDAAGDQFLAVTSDHSIHVYDLKAKQELELDLGVPKIAWAEYSPDGSSLLVIPHAPEMPEINDENQTQEEGNVDHKVLIVPINGNAITPIVHDGPVLTAHFNPNGEQIISATKKGTVALRNVKSGRVEKTFSNPGIDVKAAVLNQSGS